MTGQDRFLRQDPTAARRDLFPPSHGSIKSIPQAAGPRPGGICSRRASGRPPGPGEQREEEGGGGGGVPPAARSVLSPWSHAHIDRRINLYISINLYMRINLYMSIYIDRRMNRQTDRKGRASAPAAPCPVLPPRPGGSQAEPGPAGEHTDAAAAAAAGMYQASTYCCGPHTNLFININS